MLREVKIRRFRGFNAIDVRLAPATVVVGPNSSGKTTLLHAIRIALRALEDANAEKSAWPHTDTSKVADGWVQVAPRGVLIHDHTHYFPVTNWEALFFRQSVGENVYFEIHLVFDASDEIQELLVIVQCARNAQLKLYVDVRAPSLAALIQSHPKGRGRVNAQLTGQITSFISQHAARAVMVPSFYGVVMEEEFRTNIVLDRMLGSGDQSHIVRNLVSRLESEPLSRLNAFLRDALGAAIVRRTTSQEADSIYPLSVTFRDDDGELELSTAGAGLINLIALYASLERYRSEQKQRPVIYLLDEPEAHLHPRMQGDMAEKIASAVVKDFGAQVIMATHAVEIVNRLADRDDTVLIRIDRNATEAAVLRGQSQIVTELGQWADLTPFSMINFLAARRVLFHEGGTDKDILEICARLRYRTDSRGHDAFRAWAFAPMLGSGNEHVSAMLAHLIESKAIPSLSGQTVRLITVLDRDYQRDPGYSGEKDRRAGSKASPTLIRYSHFVWSHHSIESLFLSPQILETWIRVRLGSTAPNDLSALIKSAIDAANSDADLNEEAQAQVMAKLLRHGMEKDGKALHGEQLAVNAFREAVRLVREKPEVWQRGHSRERVILGRIRETLPASQRNTFRTDVHGLLSTTPLEKFGDTESAIPMEIRELLQHMTGDD